jgi:hypothetical protein
VVGRRHEAGRQLGAFGDPHAVAGALDAEFGVERRQRLQPVQRDRRDLHRLDIDAVDVVEPAREHLLGAAGAEFARRAGFGDTGDR